MPVRSEFTGDVTHQTQCMMKSHLLFLLLLLCLSTPCFTQCLTALPPPACNGAEPALADNETLNTGTTKWYYGPTATLNSLTLQGGTLVVCSDLTIDKFYMTGGTIFIRPGARFVIGSGIGSGLTLNGNCAIYNYGTMDVQRNLSLDNGATASTPNIIINATSTSIFRVPFQYFVINNAYSWFVNNGLAEFGGVITDQYSSPSSVCLGSGSVMRMNILINKTSNSYVVPSGAGCVSVAQTSIFNNRLTGNTNLYACLSASHSSYSGCGGCPANNWGAAQVMTGCVSCNMLGVLDIKFIDLSVSAITTGNKLQWEIKDVLKTGAFSIERSADGIHYSPIGNMPVAAGITASFNYIDKSPLTGYNYYMIKYIRSDNTTINSKAVRVSSLPQNGFIISSMPFDRSFSISFSREIEPEKVILTDIMGRNINIKYTVESYTRSMEVEVLDDIAPGIYIVHIRSDKNTMAKTILKK